MSVTTSLPWHACVGYSAGSAESVHTKHDSGRMKAVFDF